MYKKIGIGVVIGILLPLITIGIIYLLPKFDHRFVMNEEIQGSGILFGLGLNAILTWLLFRKNKEYIGRGIMISTFIYFIIWVFKFAL